MLKNPKTRPFHWVDDGRFLREGTVYDGAAIERATRIALDGCRTTSHLFDSVSLFQNQRGRDPINDITGKIG